MTPLPTPDFSMPKSLVYLVEVYHDYVWQLPSVPETFAGWLRRVVPTTRGRSVETCVYTCDTHKANPDSTEECSVYQCETHKADPESTSDCAPFVCCDPSPPTTEVFCMSNILNIPVEHMETFLAHADRYYFLLIDLLLKHVNILCIQWMTTPKLCVQLQMC
jgi:hypothetical protein